MSLRLLLLVSLTVTACNEPSQVDLTNARRVNAPAERLDRTKLVPLKRWRQQPAPAASAAGDPAPTLRRLDRSKIAPLSRGLELSTPWRVPGATRQALDEFVDALAPIVADLNADYRLPRTVPITFGACGQPNAFYDPNGPRIAFCDELINLLGQLLSDTYPDDAQFMNALKGAFVFFTIHEIAHALFAELQIPNTGNAESAADTLATVLLLQNGGAGIAAAGADAFAHLAALRERAGQPLAFWDEHQFDMQRFYEIGCLIYGSDPARFGQLLADQALPWERARVCPSRWANNAASVVRQLAPHRRRPTR